MTGKAGMLGHMPTGLATGSSGLTLAPPGGPATEVTSTVGSGVTLAPTSGAVALVAGSGSGATLAPDPVAITRGNAIGDVTGEGLPPCDMPWTWFPVTDEMIGTH